MSKETIEIKKENVMAAYNTAKAANDKGAMSVLEAMFGKETFKPKDVTERIKTFEDAIRELGEEHQYVKAYREWKRGDKNTEAFLKLRIIVAALNEGWVPTFGKGEWRYIPWIERNCVIGRANRCICECGAASDIIDRSRFVFKSKERAVYFGKQFVDIWRDFICR